MNGKLKKIITNGAFLLLCIGISVYFVFSGQDFQAVMTYIMDSSQGYWFIGLVLVIAFILCESLIIHYLLCAFGETPKPSHCCLYSFVGFFFSLVTPTASGGQPMQLVFMKRDGLSMVRCIVALLLVTITYKSVLILVGLIILIFRPASIITLLAPAMVWVRLGILLNVICVGAMFALVLVPSTAATVAFGGLNLIGKIAGEERTTHWRELLSASLETYKDASAFIKSHKRVMGNVMLITVAQRCLLFAVTYVVLLSFNIDALNIAETVLLQGSISLSADMLPLPGGLGISEHLYTLIFQSVCGDLTAPTLVISRGLSFYAQLLVSALLSAVAYMVIFGSKKGAE